MQVSEVKYLAPLGKSDHSVLVFDFHCYLDYSKPKVSFRYSKCDYNGMRAFLTTSKWVEQFKRLAVTADEEIMWSNIKGKLTEVRGKFVLQNNSEFRNPECN